MVAELPHHRSRNAPYGEAEHVPAAALSEFSMRFFILAFDTGTAIPFLHPGVDCFIGRF
jgi:hypothetical protein